MVESHVVLDRSCVMLDRGLASSPTAFDDVNFSGFREVIAVSWALCYCPSRNTKSGDLSWLLRPTTLGSRLGVGWVGLEARRG